MSWGHLSSASSESAMKVILKSLNPSSIDVGRASDVSALTIVVVAGGTADVIVEGGVLVRVAPSGSEGTAINGAKGVTVEKAVGGAKGAYVEDEASDGAKGAYVEDEASDGAKGAAGMNGFVGALVVRPSSGVLA